MIVCLCKGVNEKEIEKKLDEMCCANYIKRKTGAGTGCGKCVKVIEKKIKQRKEKV